MQKARPIKCCSFNLRGGDGGGGAADATSRQSGSGPTSLNMVTSATRDVDRRSNARARAAVVAAADTAAAAAAEAADTAAEAARAISPEHCGCSECAGRFMCTRNEPAITCLFCVSPRTRSGDALHCREPLSSGSQER